MVILAQNSEQMVAETFRVVGAMGAKERVVAEGLTREAAEQMRRKMRADILCCGYAVWIECEQREAR